ncbi:hard surface induced protein (acyltransferase) [Colletotrichum truncatum]|uniref:Hard surface induced protein (Acyltransferase) n=1 Tax=Colletotrichum truncatum TaxID=5467 RepID=A0ACC3YD41_COLTU|nr:hard surface induced protein (acyltransferase) [Colletotrichum truncatum]KAF6784781.1 hard surface induced protein (acyltransferase) [Colletotrichum truncatum]
MAIHTLATRAIRGVVTRFSPGGLYSYTPLSNTNSSSPPSTPGGANHTAHPKSFLAKLTAFLIFLLPSFIQRRLRPDEWKARRLYPTSWLDGLRGVASFIVFICHYTGPEVGSYLARPYGNPAENDRAGSSPLQLAFVRVIYSGKPMVHIFFVISGFVLSLKSLKQARKHDYDGLHRTLSSSVFRRGFRLFLPTTASTFMIMIMIRLGWLGKPLPTLWEQLVDWKNALWQITFSWKWDITQLLPYDVHLWTIPIEFSNSLLLFVVLTGVSRMKTYLRLPTVFAIMIYCLKSGRWAAFEFLGGMGLAEIGLIQDARRERSAAVAHVKEEEGVVAQVAGGARSLSSSSVATLAFKTFLVGNLIFALFVAGWPDQAGDISPGLAVLHRNTMEPYYSLGGDLLCFFWYAIGAVQIVFALQQIKTLQDVFVTAPVQYLADISYALYLVHGPVLDVFAHRWMPYVWALVGGKDEAGMWGRMVAWFIGFLLMGVPTIWGSDLFWRTVDVKSVELARWIEAVCVRED